jgi:hypothetical protein
MCLEVFPANFGLMDEEEKKRAVTGFEQVLREIDIKYPLRVLRPGGFAIIQVPLDSARAETYENSEIRTPEERLRHFGQDDHVRIYGRDYPDRLRKAGFSVHRLPYARRLGWLRSWWCSLRYREILHICTKPVL